MCKEAYPEQYSEGYQAFYCTERMRVISKTPPEDPVKVVEHQKRKAWIQGWIDAKEDYDGRTAKQK